MKELELAWAAGFIDGEGCVTIGKGYARRKNVYRPRLILSVSQSYPEPLERLARIAGHGNINGPYHYKSNPLGKKPIYRWVLQSWRVEEFMEELRPWLCSEKINRYEECQRWLTEFCPSGKIIL
jgi:hypothetical protein